MTLSDLSIRRPVLATVASLLIVVLGIGALIRLPIRELPDIDNAIVTVTTELKGAAPEIIDTDITEVIESAVAGISGVKSITSFSRRGRSRTVVEFEIGRDPDEAANDVRDAVGRARGDLPQDVEEPQIVKSDSDSEPVMRLAVTSTRMSPPEITDYLERFVVDRLATLDGVASVDIQGSRRYAVRIWLDRAAMAARNLTVAQVESALRRNNVELPAGEVESLNLQLSIRLDSRLQTVESFRNIVVDRIAGYPVRLSDIATVELGAEDDKTIVRANGVQAIGLAVLRQAKANTIAISNAVRKEIENLKATLPEGMTITVGSDDALFVAASIKEVLIALGIAMVLVVLVILAFLASVRATLVPAVTIPVSLIGCFLIIWVLGYSINVLTLLALILAIGLVVDDAIVVLENVQRRVDYGESPLVASTLGTRQVTFAVLATSLTLVAVFVPISFLEGEVGRLFTEFGFVMAGAVLISTFVALSLCPMLTAKLLTPSAEPVKEGAPPRGFMGAVARSYRHLLERAVKAPAVVIGATALFAGGSWFVYQGLPRELTPREDRGVIFMPITAPEGSTVRYTNTQNKTMEEAVASLRASGDVETVYSVVGSAGRTNRGFVVLRLKHWDEREKTASEILSEIRPKMARLTGAKGSPAMPAGLGVKGSRTPVRVVVANPDFENVKVWAKALLRRAEENSGLDSPELDFEENQPQLTLKIDRTRADDLGIGVETIAATLQTFFASREITDYIDRGRAYPVIVQAKEGDRRTPDDIRGIFVRAGDNQTLIPLTALVSVSEGAAAPELRRYNRLPAIALEAGLKEDYDLGSALNYLEKAAAEILPPEVKLKYAGPSQQFKETSGGVAVTLALAFLIVFLVLAAQFESFVHPLIIMLSVPLALAGAVYSLLLGGLSLNVYSQIGIILLVGLMAKNGILIVEFANQLRDRGYGVREAVIEASVLRLRPIVMTVISTILGAVPLMLASGAGAESREAIGTVIVGGLGGSLVLTLFLTPVLYDLMAGYTRPRGAIEKALEAELAGISGARV
ncbi:MAG TPA: efflux RND transporter permease subunit [Hyphomicrobiaceae bacterium]|nr:efflux RND transporter permease subunit [Hyphomicrobiaceae bacterium]